MNKQEAVSRRILLLITRMEDKRKVFRLMRRLQLPVCYQCRANGSADARLLKECDLHDTKRLITASVIPDEMVTEAFSQMAQSHHFSRRGCGIALVLPVAVTDEDGGRKGAYANMGKSETAYSMILVTANAAYSGQIIDAAQKGGAKGGTIVKTRRKSLEQEKESSLAQLLGMNGQDQQETTMIVVPQNVKGAVLAQVNQSCGPQSPAQGIILCVPVESVFGIEE